MDTYRRNAGNLMAVISPDFCFPETVHLKITRKSLAITHGNFDVSDEHGNLMFKVKDKLLSLHDRHLILDPEGIPIITLIKNKISVHKRWLVFKGESANSTDLLFSVRKTSVLQVKTELDVYLSGNWDESSWDFKVVGSLLERSCDIYDKYSSPIAKMYKNRSFGCMVRGKDTYEVTVSPKVDHAFVIALVVILYEINEDD